MTQKQALKQLEDYCKVNNMHLTSSSFERNVYALVVHDAKQTGNRVIEGGIPCRRLSGYHKPKELLIWIDGYHAGLQNIINETTWMHLQQPGCCLTSV